MKSVPVVLALLLVVVTSPLFFLVTSCSDELVIHDIWFDSQGGSDVATVIVVDGQIMNEPAHPMRNGYLFGGWYEESDCVNEWDFATDAVESDMTLYAKWIAEDYLVTLDKQGGSGGSDSIIATYDSKMPSATAPIKTGYVFNGYYDQNDGGGIQYYPSTMESSKDWDKISDTTLYAKWTAGNYIVTYDANGARGGAVPTEQTKTYDVDLTIWGNTGALIREGYTFDGWNTLSNGSGIDYATGSPYTANTTATLYAKWIPVNYVIMYELGSGTNSASNPDTYTVEDESITFAAPTRTGYAFGGWFASGDFSGSAVTSTPRGSTGNKTLYAKWTANSYAITYNLNGGTNDSSNPDTYTIESSTITIQNPTRAGYAFGGWFASDDFSGSAVTSIPRGSTGNKTLYAKWIANSYAITYNLNGGTNDASNPYSYTIDDGSITFAAPTRLGYEFGGWFSNNDFSGYPITQIDTGSTEERILFAKWTAVTYSITYVLNNGTNDAGNPSSYTIENSTITMLVPERIGYPFEGWFENSDFSGSPIVQIATGSTGDKTLYAKWKAYQIGDIGPSGGYIFYAKGVYDDGWQYLEAAPYGWYKGATDSDGVYSGETDPCFQWGAYGYEVDPSASADALGTGKTNTTNIVSYHDALGDYYSDPTKYHTNNDGTVAAKVCAEYSLEQGGMTYDDWFLPSKAELYRMYQNLHLRGLGDFYDSWAYWSSTEYSDKNKAYCQAFNSFFQGSSERYNDFLVRPARAF